MEGNQSKLDQLSEEKSQLVSTTILFTSIFQSPLILVNFILAQLTCLSLYGVVIFVESLFEPRREKTMPFAYANNEDADQLHICAS